MYIYLTEVVFRNIFSNVYLIVLETINQGTREHRCRYGHHATKIN